jgi:hypothetical protein
MQWRGVPSLVRQANSTVGANWKQNACAVMATVDQQTDKTVSNA